MAPKNNPRFAHLVAETFSAMGVTQTQFHDKGGPSDTTLRKITEGKIVGVSVRTLNGLDKAFDWEPGSAARALAGGDPTPLVKTPAEPVPNELLSAQLLECESIAAGIGAVGNRLLAMNWDSPKAKADLALNLAQLASDVADALFSFFEESPPLRPLYADAFAQSLVASRSFVAAYDQLVEPSERVGDNFDRSASLAYGFRPGSSEKEIKDAVDDAPESGAPGQAGEAQEEVSPDDPEAAIIANRLKAMEDDGGLNNPDDPLEQRG